MRAILTFHSIDDSGSVLSFPPATFAELIAALPEADLPILDLETLLAPSTARGVAITFDDGMKSVHTSAMPVLREHAVPSHLFLTTSAVGGTNRWPTQPAGAPAFEMLEWPALDDLQKAGMRIESHTHTHPDLRRLGTDAIVEECMTADRIIEARTGRPPRFFAYPYGRTSEAACDVARARYQASVTVVLRKLQRAEDRARLPRLDSHYLRHSWLFPRLGQRLPGAYFALRGALRRLKGSQ